MSFQAYLDTIKTKTGKSPEDFLQLAQSKGLLEEDVKTGQIVSWLKEDYGLGQGHAMALIVTFNAATKPKQSTDERTAMHFSGKRAHWRSAYDDLVNQVSGFGTDVSIKLGSSYVSLLRNGKKFGIVQITADRMDIGIKLKGVEATNRFELAGSWNSMVTHRVRINEANDLDDEVLRWLKQAYNAS